MLTSSALFCYYVFQRLLFNIRKLADEEHIQENPDAKSVIVNKEELPTVEEGDKSKKD